MQQKAGLVTKKKKKVTKRKPDLPQLPSAGQSPNQNLRNLYFVNSADIYQNYSTTPSQKVNRSHATIE